MRFLFASIWLVFFISCSEAIKKEDFKMLYPDKEKPIKFQQDWQFEFYYNRIEEFKVNPIGFNKIDNSKIFHPTRVDFFDIKNKKICDLDLTQFNSEKNKYTTLKRSTLI